jgi:hypothetical protein
MTARGQPCYGCEQGENKKGGHVIDSSWIYGKPRGLVDLREQVDLVRRDGVPLERFAIDVGIGPHVMTALAKLRMEEVWAIQNELEYLDVPSARLRQPDLEAQRGQTDDRVIYLRVIEGGHPGADNGNGLRRN